MTTNYEWRASNSAPKGCPMEIVSGNFFFPGAGSLYIPPTGLHAGWGREVSAHVIGDDVKPIPDRMEVLFFSYLENKFYRGQFALPRDSIARLFAEGYTSAMQPSTRATYDVLVAGVAPGGAVAVWASGAERQVEVFFGQAEPVDLDWHKTLDMPPSVDRQVSVANELTEAAQRDPLVRPMMAHVPAASRWASYRTRYRWRPTFEGLDRPERLDRVEFVNGERDYIPLQPAPAADAARPAPRFLLLSDVRAHRYYRVTFDDEETVAAFAQLGAGGTPIELVFIKAAGDGASGSGTSALQVHVRGATETVPLRKVKWEVYDAA